MGRGERSAQMTGGTVARSRRNLPQIAPAAVLPKQMSDYFQAIEAKHFNRQTALGSYFTDPEINSLEDLIAKAAAMPGGLDRDERALFNRDALRDDCRYLRVPAQGKSNLINSRDLDGQTKVEVIRSKPGVPCSLVVDDCPEQETDFATVIIGPRPNSGGECVWTAHPGPPVRPAQEDLWPEGSTITVDEVRRNLGDCWLQGRAGK